jgi:hypothetical protein
MLLTQFVAETRLFDTAALMLCYMTDRPGYITMIVPVDADLQQECSTYTSVCNI